MINVVKRFTEVNSKKSHGFALRAVEIAIRDVLLTYKCFYTAPPCPVSELSPASSSVSQQIISKLKTSTRAIQYSLNLRQKKHSHQDNPLPNQNMRTSTYTKSL